MTSTRQASGETQDRAPARRRAVWALAAALLLAALAGWWWLSTPRLEAGGYSGVWSIDHPVVEVEGPATRLYIVPGDEPGETLVAFMLSNTGPLPVRVRDVWPDPAGRCFWAPRSRELRDDPERMFTYDSPARDAVGATIPAGGMATVWVRGAHPDPEGCEHAGLTWTDEVDVVVSVAGRTSAVSLPLGYQFGYTDDPDGFAEQYGVSSRDPSPDLPRR